MGAGGGGGPNWAAVNEAAKACLPTLLSRWLPDGRQRGREWVARNPTRSDRKAGSFQINMRTGKWIDWATDDRGGDPISLYAYLYGLGQRDAERELAGDLGVDPDLPRVQRPGLRAAPPDRSEAYDREAGKRRGWAKGIWGRAGPAAGTVVETYLRGRGITLPVPPSLRLGMLKHAATGDHKHPVMIGCMQVGPKVVGVHRTYLGPDGKKAEIWIGEGRRRQLAETKMMLGQAQGAAVRLAPPAASLALSEGIETGLSALQLAPGWCVWAALSAGNMAEVAIPPWVKRLVYIVDSDRKYDPKQRAWRKTGFDKAMAAARAHEGLGIPTTLVVPDDRSDLNDTLRDDPEQSRNFARFMAGALITGEMAA